MTSQILSRFVKNWQETHTHTHTHTHTQTYPHNFCHVAVKIIILFTVKLIRHSGYFASLCTEPEVDFWYVLALLNWGHNKIQNFESADGLKRLMSFLFNQYRLAT